MQRPWSFPNNETLSFAIGIKGAQLSDANPNKIYEERKQPREISRNSRQKNNLKNEGDSAGSSNTGDRHHRDTAYDHTTIFHVSVMTVLSTAAGFLSKHPESQTVAEGSTASFTCELKNSPVCFVHWTAIDTETGLMSV